MATTRRWSRVRHFVFKSDAYRCTSCGKAVGLECDHVTRLQLELFPSPPKLEIYAAGRPGTGERRITESIGIADELSAVLTGFYQCTGADPSLEVRTIRNGDVVPAAGDLDHLLDVDDRAG